MKLVGLAILFTSISCPLPAREIRVPLQARSIQAGIDQASYGDTVLVSPGTYYERISISAGVTVRSLGNDSGHDSGRDRAELTVIDGGGVNGDTAGVEMGQASELDGFTITHVGLYDEQVWKMHFTSNGEELGDDEGAVLAEGTVPAVRIQAQACVVKNCIVHHNGDVGIAILGTAEFQLKAMIENNKVSRNLGGGIGLAVNTVAVVTNNTCFENLRAGIGCRAASPVITQNTCFGNIRAGIGCREGACPIIRGNVCYKNRRAGIGVRMKGTSPLIESNRCYENEMAGIGNRDEASPVIRGNECFRNKMAGIGSDGSSPLIVSNTCRENLMAGIGLQNKATAIIIQNRCLENALVAIGITQGSTASIADNELKRTGGQPPIVAIKDQSKALITNNRIYGGGVAGILVQGTVTIDANHFESGAPKQGNAIWVWDKSVVTVVGNNFQGYRSAVRSAQSKINVLNNIIRRFGTVAIDISDDNPMSNVLANKAYTDNKDAVVWRRVSTPNDTSGNVIVLQD
ncbi:right-handed parallel beta-helix repeat-containing protein [Pirellulaceae bacterium]|nr:right-handed parallel beta-helix repeat-containing protein [Pirellulaceae bacterium]